MELTHEQRSRAHAYSAMPDRPINYSQSLWKVNDVEYNKPGERFISDGSRYLESVLEASMSGPLESAPIPEGLRAFVKDMVQTLGVDSTEHSTINDVMMAVISFLDYTGYTYLISDAKIQLNSNQLNYTYRKKGSGEVLLPNQLECYNVIENYTYPAYETSIKFLDHPAAKKVLAGEQVPHAQKGGFVTREDLVATLANILYGSREHLLSEVEGWLHRHYDNLRYRSKLELEVLNALDAYESKDLAFWESATIAILLWFKSPYALRYLTEYHPIYQAVIRWDGQDFVTIPGSGGEVILDRWDVFTLMHLDVEKAVRPGRCGCCGQDLHCTKHVNSRALFHPKCSCGQLVPVEDIGFRGHSWRDNCKPYLDAHPPYAEFVCQRCLSAVVFQGDPKTAKCGRFECPNTQCKHHAGKQAYVNELRRRRNLLLADRAGQYH